MLEVQVDSSMPLAALLQSTQVIDFANVSDNVDHHCCVSFQLSLFDSIFC